MNEELTDFSVEEGKSAVEVIATHMEFNKITEFIAELLGKGLEIGHRLFLMRESIADILNVLGDIDMEYDEIRIAKNGNYYLLFINTSLLEALRRKEFVRNTEGLWVAVSIYCMTNDDYKLVRKLIEKHGMKTISSHLMVSRK